MKKVMIKKKKMQHNSTFWTTLFQQERGIAILMVLSSVAILAFLLADFTFETKINKFKVYNRQDKIQAKINAESGLKFALAKLKLYQEGRNLLEKTEGAKDLISADQIESIITQPFMYPIPLPPSASIIQKNALDEFIKNTVIQGQLSVEITSVSGFLNPNNLRIKSPKKSEEEEKEEERDRRYDEDLSEDEEKEDDDDFVLHTYIEKQLLDTLTAAIESKKETDENFDILYAHLQPELLIKELKYYVNDKNKFNEPELADIEGRYLAKDITPKHAPLASISELYLLDGWNDTVVDLIKDRLTVHEATIISLNQLTDKQLKIIFPNITPEQSEDFFRHRDGSPAENEDDEEYKPHPFTSENDFKDLVVNKLSIVDENGYKKRIDELTKAGIKLDVAGKLFKVISKGQFGRATYTIKAFIDLPVRPTPPKKKKKKKKKPPTPKDPNDDLPPEPEREPPEEEDEEKKSKKKAPPLELLEPRIVEMYVE